MPADLLPARLARILVDHDQNTGADVVKIG